MADFLETASLASSSLMDTASSFPSTTAIFRGPQGAWKDGGETIRDLLPYADGLFVTRGVLRSVVDPDGNTPIILSVSGATSVVGQDLANEVLTTSIEEIIRLNVAAVGLSIFKVLIGVGPSEVPDIARGTAKSAL